MIIISSNNYIFSWIFRSYRFCNIFKVTTVACSNNRILTISCVINSISCCITFSNYNTSCRSIKHIKTIYNMKRTCFFSSSLKTFISLFINILFGCDFPFYVKERYTCIMFIFNNFHVYTFSNFYSF